MKHRYLTNVVTLRLDAKRCIACGMCMEVCPHSVFVLAESTVEIRDRDACMECGACARNCPAQALSVRTGVGCAYAILNANNPASCCSVGDKTCG